MLNKIIEGSVRNRFLVSMLLVIALSLGVFAMRGMPLDAIPDLSDVQVIIFTEFPGQSPQIVEDQVTYPLTTTMLAVPYAKVVRGYSFFGFSFVYILFEDGTDMYWARSRVLEYLNYVRGQLPENVNPALGPDATGVGWVYEYILESDRHDLAELRSMQDWYVRYELQQVQGVSEVASLGGYVRQYQITVDPQKLQAYNLSITQVRDAVRRNNNDVGGRVVELAETEFMVRGLGYIKTLDDIRKIPLGVSASHVPILLENVAQVALGPDLRRGVTDWNGEGEVVGGIVVMRYEGNALEVIKDVKKRLAEIEESLPEGVRITTAYDRSTLIEHAVETLGEKILEECIVVALICIVFLLHVRSALVAIFTLPAGIILAFLVMRAQGLSADIMSLGGIAIAIGAMIDASIVMIENMHKHIEHAEPGKDRWEIVIESSKEVAPSLFYSLLIIAFSFLPVFALEAQEGRLFKPLAYTKTYAMIAGAVLSVTVVPILMGYFVRGRIRPEHKNPINRALLFVYRPTLLWALRHPKTMLLSAVVLVVVTIWPVSRLGSEFMPPLYEGDLLYMPSLLPGVSITAAKQTLQQTDRIIKSFPEVAHVFGKAGRARTATDPAPLNMVETIIALKPEEEWRPGMTPEKLVKELDAAIQFPGVTNAWTMPIKTRIDMLSTGIKTPIGIKLLGPDLEKLADLGAQMEALLRNVPGTTSVYAERVTGGNYLDVDIDRDAIARYGIDIDEVQAVIMSSIGGVNVSQTVEGLERYPINVRYPREFRESLEQMRGVLVYSPLGHHVPLGELATLHFVKGPPSIKSEGSRPTAWIYVDITDSDIGGYVARAKEVIAREVQMPPGYRIIWSGQFEYMERATQRLKLILPVTLIIVFLLLFLNFRTLSDSLMIMLLLPLALTGGFWFLWLLDYDLSVAVGVGFIALAGVSAETGVVMLVYLHHALRKMRESDEPQSEESLRKAIIAGAAERVRPKMMTVFAIVGGLIPIMWSSGAGASVMKRIAAPMIGGMVSATLLTLLVIPVAYELLERRKLGQTTSEESA
ncbi:MAG: CusA/CzcA family heavy metal efflux RND transporter [Deltaproteobacteria bacterium]|nr:CusA/CzcA family heavy metal efflux RND transporter [Deltaproteobacteria bacterium]